MKDHDRTPDTARAAPDAQGAATPHPGYGIDLLDRPPGLPAPLKAGVEQLSGLAMDDVRVHYDSPRPAGLGALAYAQGSDIFLGPGQERHLPHEAWHVVQQKQGRVQPEAPRLKARLPLNTEPALEREADALGAAAARAASGGPGTAPARVQRDPPPPYLPVAQLKGREPPKAKAKEPAKFYQEVIEALDSLSEWYIPSSGLPYIRNLLRLCEATEAKDLAAIQKWVPLVMADPPPSGAPYERSENFVNDLLVRILEMGLDREALRLRTFFRGGGRSEPPISKFGADKRLWQRLAYRAIEQADFSKAEAATASIDQLLAAFWQIRREAERLDFDKVKQSRELGKLTDASDPYGLTESDTLASYFSTLIHQLRELAVPLFRAVHTLMEDAVARFEADAAKDGEAALQRLESVLDGKLKPAFDAVVGDRHLGGLSLEATRSAFTDKGGEHRDYFDRGKTGGKRGIAIDFFDKDQIGGVEKYLPVARIFAVRKNQIDFLRRLYTQENRAAMGKQALRLENIDDWRRFLEAQYLAKAEPQAGDAKAGPLKADADAYRAVIRLLEGYADAFTISTPYNIEDFVKREEDNYLKRPYPRALTGQLIQDCGVYALRWVYMLSLLKEKLKLKFSLIVLPVHVGLIITGEGLPTYIIHNGNFHEVTDAKLAALRKDWEPPDPKTSEPDANRQLLATVAAGMFSMGVDLPFRLEDLPDNLKAKDPALKQNLQGFYEKKVVGKKLLADDPKAGISQFQLRYLDLNKEKNRIHNELAIPAWKSARGVWRKHRDKLHAELAKAFVGQPHGYPAASAAYLADLDQDPAFSHLNDALKQLTQRRNAVSKDLGEHPALVAPGSKVARSTLAPSKGRQLILGWEYQLQEHREHVADLKKALESGVPEDYIKPPFADEKDALEPVY